MTSVTATPEPAHTAAQEEARRRILAGAIRSIARHGLERSSIASTAREAGMSRQTVYAYYANREDLLRDAITTAALELMDEVVQKAAGATSAADFLVELTVRVIQGVRRHPAISSMLYSLDSPQGREMTMSPAIRSVVIDTLTPVLRHDPTLEPRLDEIAETQLRLTVSLLTYPSERTADDDTLRSYLAAVLPGLLGLSTR